MNKNLTGRPETSQVSKIWGLVNFILIMIPSGSNKKIIQNKQASLSVDLFGGAIINFHLNDEEKINPLS
ncbi:MAG: hypothetical protein ABJA79_08805, partial [Parafilimonas sp.]